MMFVDVWVTCPSREAAETIAIPCLQERLAACANIVPGVASIFRWKGAVERGDEVVLLLKTRQAYFFRLAARIRELHPYETPAITAAPISMIDPATAEWLTDETE